MAIITGYEKYIKFLLKLLLLAVIFFAVYFVIEYLLPFLAPFIVAIIIALITEPLISLLHNKAKLPRSIAAVISLLLTISILGFILVVGSIKIYNELVVLQGNISNYIQSTSDQITQYLDKAAAFYQTLPKEISDTITEGIKSLAPQLQGLLGSVVNYIIGTVKSIPNIFVFITVTLLATYFISSDRVEIRNFVYKQLPANWSKTLPGIKDNAFHAIAGYFKALLILMMFTFIEVSVGLVILKVDYALLLGLVVAICEIIPVLGTGIIMVPWIGVNLLLGNVQLAVGLSIVYLIGVVIRQVTEPKIVGSQIGLHPLATLLSMYIGLSLFGVLGMIIGPISIIILKSLQTAGVLHLWKS
ncbi:MAG: sporulation integral membrane protein YtvI [Bacillota bacterium]|nr:sporulation integral membrane protein YtvI [Bacillota bacterium]